jgi:hypothetical protein
MVIYFKDGELQEEELEYIKSLPSFQNQRVVALNAKFGVSACEETLQSFMTFDKWDNDGSISVIDTNYLGAMKCEYSWDYKNHTYAIMLQDDDKHWVHIDETTARELRFAMNIPKLYLGGEFRQ